MCGNRSGDMVNYAEPIHFPGERPWYTLRLGSSLFVYQGDRNPLFRIRGAWYTLRLGSSLNVYQGARNPKKPPTHQEGAFLTVVALGNPPLSPASRTFPDSGAPVYVEARFEPFRIPGSQRDQTYPPPRRIVAATHPAPPPRKGEAPSIILQPHLLNYA